MTEKEIQNATTLHLCNVYEDSLFSGNNDDESLKLRGMISLELQKRDPIAFGKWIFNDSDSIQGPRDYYL